MKIPTYMVGVSIGAAQGMASKTYWSYITYSGHVLAPAMMYVPVHTDSGVHTVLNNAPIPP